MRYNLTWKTSLAHLRQRLCWQGRMTTGLENISRQTGQISCFSRFSMVVPPPAPGPGRPADGGLKPRVKFMTSRVGEKTRWAKETEFLVNSLSIHPIVRPLFLSSCCQKMFLLQLSVEPPMFYSTPYKVSVRSCPSLYPTGRLSKPHVKTLPCPRSQFHGSYTVGGRYF